MSKESAIKLPPPRAAIRAKRVLVALTAGEYEGLVSLAESRQEPPAGVARMLIVSALESLRAER